MHKIHNITVYTLATFDEWLLNNPDITQDDREVIIEFVSDYVKQEFKGE